MKLKHKQWLTRFALLGIALVIVNFFCLPRLLPHVLSWWQPDICFRGDVEGRRLYLTIDDGPSDSTPAILAVLKKHDVPAVFFITSCQVHSDGQLQSIVDAGHALGHHMCTFERGDALSLDQFSADFDFTDRQLRHFSTPIHFRPPSAAATPEQLVYVRSKGYQPILGTVYPFDHAIENSQLLKFLVRWLAIPGGIVIMHDGDERGRTTAHVLDAVLPALKRAGYEFEALESVAPHKTVKTTAVAEGD